jgi:phospholipase C
MIICIADGHSLYPMQAMMVLVLWCLGIAICAGDATAQPTGLEKIQHVIVIYQENWTFDGLYGKFPGADGIANAGERIRQVKKDGTPYTTLPQPLDTAKNPPIPDPRFPADLPVAPYDAARYVPPDQKIGDIVNHALQEERQINGGRMDGFVALSDNGGLALSYYDATDLPVGRLAQQYTLADRFFHSGFDGSLFNHFWLVCACTPAWPDAPANLRIQLDAHGSVIKDGSVTPDGYVVHTVYSKNRPYPAKIKDPAQLMPLLTVPTIGDRLSAKGVSGPGIREAGMTPLRAAPIRCFNFTISRSITLPPTPKGRLPAPST